jgi:ketosteroid isomerase-like protein
LDVTPHCVSPTSTTSRARLTLHAPSYGGSIQKRESPVSENKRTVERYIDGFNKSDHEQILGCLTEDIQWTVFGAFHLVGKDAYDKEIENPAFTGSPEITILRMVEENDVVMAELTLVAKPIDADPIRMVAGEVFVMRDALIKERRAYLIPLRENNYK